MRASALALSGVVFLASGCALLPVHSGQAEHEFAARRAQLEAIDRFTMQARVSSGFFGVKGSLFWRQEPAQFQMRFAGPMGANAVSIAGDAQEVRIRTAAETHVTEDPERFLQERLGWTFPLRQLRWWALGLPAPDSPASRELDGSGRLVALEQDGWRLEFDEYQPAGAVELPRRFELANGEARIKVVVDDWAVAELVQ